MFLELPYNGRVVRLTHFVKRGDIVDDGNDNGGGGGIGGNNVYRGRAEPMLVLLSDLYSKDKISVGDSRFSSCPAYTIY